MALPGLILAAAVSAAVLSPGVVFVDSAITHGREVRLGDIADVSALPADIRARAAVLVLAHVPPHQRQLRISAARLAERARARLPLLAGYLGSDDGRVVTVRFNGPEASAPPRAAVSADCMRVVKPIAPGAAPIAGELEQANCGPAAIKRAFGYDPINHVARAVRSLSVGEVVAAPPASSIAAVRAGDSYTLTARSGPVAVQRRVVAVQPARAGEEMFVAGDDGQVFAAPQPNSPEAP